MSTKKRSKFKLEELFSASSFGVCLYIKSDLHKILDKFYLLLKTTTEEYTKIGYFLLVLCVKNTTKTRFKTYNVLARCLTQKVHTHALGNVHNIDLIP